MDNDNSAFEVLLNNCSQQDKEKIADVFNEYIQQHKMLLQTLGLEKTTQIFHSMIDDLMQNAFIKEQRGQITCKRGCSFCCYLRVTMTEGEAKILAKGITPEQISALKTQAGRPELKSWQQLPYQNRKCIFLKNNECSVYENRPASCRKYVVINKPKRCNTQISDTATQLILSDILVELVTGAFCSEQNNGFMPDMILKEINTK